MNTADKQQVNHINVKNLLEIAAALSKEKDYNKLLTRILREAMDITNCDGGTLYLLIDGALHFKIMRTISMNYYKGADGEKIALPPVALSKKNVCACAALNKQMINIDDVYCSDKYDFSGPRNYDKMTGYQTRSMLVVPMEDYYGDIIGVLQLINAQNQNGEVIAFNKKYEEAITSLASLAAVSITNMNYIEEIKEILHSFVEVISTAIDERTPYNANHTKNMVRYGKAFIKYLNEQVGGIYTFDENREEQFLMSVWLHDIGKMVIPLEIMNKETRLSSAIYSIKSRFELIGLLNKIALLRGEISEQDYEQKTLELNDDLKMLEQANTIGFLNDDLLSCVRAVAAKTYRNEQGEVCFYLTEEEYNLLTIRFGTLTNKERQIMESHVAITEKLLNKIAFSKDYNNVTFWASSHHEYLNGCGYPRHLTADELPFEVRVLTILDIYDALTARDRPYKPPMPAEKALAVLDDMADKGQLDKKVVELFIASCAWEAK
ncbi:MAG: GAF domain-containing protein [Clostridia bacterium]|nr:GAF domain-containing protein [Clostridia bacterium]